MTSKKHLHPIALLPFFYRTIHDWLVPLIGAAWAMIKLYANQPLLFQGLTIAVVIIVLGIPITHYLTFTYQLTAQAIIVQHGLFFKKRNHIPYDRIQNVTTNQWFFLKPFNLVELVIETAGHSDSGAEVTLTAVSGQLVNTLAQYRQARTVTPQAATTVSEQITADTTNSYQINNRFLWLFAATSPAFLTALLAIATFYGRIERTIPRRFYQTLFQNLGHFGLVIIVLVLLSIILLVYLVSALILISQYYHFRLIQQNNQLMTERGFFQKKVVSLATARIQAIKIQQSLLRGWLRMATIQLVIVSNSKKDDAAKNLVIMPLIPVSQVDAFLQQFLPDIPQLTQITRSPINPRTRFYNWRNAILVSLLLWLPVLWLTRRLPFVLILTSLILFLILLVPAELQTRRSQLSTVNSDYLYLQRNNWLTRNQYLIKRSNIQSVELTQSKWLVTKKLASFTVHVRSGNGQTSLKVRYLSVVPLTAALNWYRQPPV